MAGKASTNSSPWWAANRSITSPQGTQCKLCHLDGSPLGKTSRELGVDTGQDGVLVLCSSRILEHELPGHLDSRTVHFDDPRIAPDRIAERQFERLRLTGCHWPWRID